VAAILDGGERASRVRAVGSKGSKNLCFHADGAPIHLDHYNDVFPVEENRVTAQAGATVGELNAVLRRHGLALPTHGEWAGATVAGAAATGTHGGSCSHGIFSDSICSLSIIPADGVPRKLDRDSRDFHHAGVSFGALGIISAITFECEEKFFLEMRSQALPFERYLLQNDKLIRENEFFSAIWSPQARRVLTFEASRVPEQKTTGSRRNRFCLLHCIHNAVSCFSGVDAFPSRWSEIGAVDECYGVLSPLLAQGRRAKALSLLGKAVRAAEFAVPLSRAVETLDSLDRFFFSHRMALALPVGIRPTAKDQFSLSPCYGRDAFWIDIFFFPNQRFESALRGLFEGLEARSHWGKHIGLSTEHLRKQYPRWEAFWKARDRLDPERVFANDFTRSLEQ